MTRDRPNYEKKCGEDPDSPNRSFKLSGASATEANCKKKCEEDMECIAMSGIWGIGISEHWFCIGCKVPLYTFHRYAKAFKRDVKGKILMY